MREVGNALRYLSSRTVHLTRLDLCIYWRDDTRTARKSDVLLFLSTLSKFASVVDLRYTQTGLFVDTVFPLRDVSYVYCLSVVSVHSLSLV